MRHPTLHGDHEENLDQATVLGLCCGSPTHVFDGHLGAGNLAGIFAAFVRSFTGRRYWRDEPGMYSLRSAFTLS